MTDHQRLRALHRAAMTATDLAFAARQNKDEAQALVYFRRACDLEAQAADLVAEARDIEPTRSVLHRSAASLALDYGDWRRAEFLAARGLIGNPPDEIADELREVLDQSRFDRHLAVQDIVLSTDEFQFVIDGPSIAPGLARVPEFLERVRDVERIVVRTASRLLNRPFQDKVRDPVPVFISTPRAGSFAVSLKLGLPHQTLLPGFEDAAYGFETRVVNEVLDCIQLVNNNDQESLRNRFAPHDPAYFQNFLALSQKIAPDGANVNMVGFTALQDQQERRIVLSRPKANIFLPAPAAPALGDGKELRLVGRLRYADEVSENNTIKLVQPGKTRATTIIVPAGLLTDIVAPLWGKMVEASIIQYAKSKVLRSIEERPEPDTEAAGDVSASNEQDASSPPRLF